MTLVNFKKSTFVLNNLFLVFLIWLVYFLFNILLTPERRKKKAEVNLLHEKLFLIAIK